MNLASLRPAKDFAIQFGCKAIIYGAPGSAKCLAPGTLILMFDGSIKTVEHVKVNDLIMGPDSLPRKVISLANGFEDMFDVIPTKGEKYRVNKSHILSIFESGKNRFLNIPLETLLYGSNEFKHHAKGWRTKINFANKDVYINPYLLGLWLGDGSSDELAFHTIDKPIVDFLNHIAPYYGVSVKYYKNIDKCPRYRLTGEKMGKNNGNRLRECFNHYKLFNNKHVPFDFKCNSAQIRANVLAGLLDTDGSLQSNCFSYVSKLEILADDVCFLARSLGLAAYKSIINNAAQTGIVGKYYRVSISGNTNIIPTQLERKKATERKQTKNVLFTGIKLEYAGYGEYYGFELEGPDKLFVLADFTVTHNTPGINYAPRPLLLATEPGLLSMRGSNVPTFCAFTPEAIDEFFDWFFKSNETKNFDTLAIDSVSQMADIYLQKALGKKTSGGNRAHGKAAYGQMATDTLEHIRTLYYTRQKHTYLIAKQWSGEENGVQLKKPYFPGQQLPVEIPHMFDFILHLGIQNIPGMGQYSAFRCIGSIDTMARNRTGNLNEFEEPHIGKLYQKAMS